MRIYSIKYDFYLPAGGGFKYAFNPQKEERTETYTIEERQVFINNYQRYKKDDLVYGNVKAFVGELTEIENMQAVIDAI